MSNEIIRNDTVDLSVLNTQEPGFSLAELKQIIYRRWKPALTMAIAASTGMFLFMALQTPEYISETQILIDNSKTQQAASVSPGEEAMSRYYSIKDLTTEIFVLRSTPMIVKALETIQDQYHDLIPAQILRNLTIYQASIDKIPTDVLVISYVDEDPQRAKVVLEALGSTYVEYSLDKQRSQAINAIKFIDTQLVDAQEKVDEAGREIRQFRQVNKMVDPNISASGVEEIKQTIEQEIRQTQIAIALNNKQTKELEHQLAELGQDSETMLASSVLGEDGVYSNLATQLKEVEAEYNLGKVTFHETYYVMEDLKERRAELKKLLHERAEQVLGKSISPAVLDRLVVAAQNNINTNSPTVDVETPETDTSAANSNINESASGTKVSTDGSILGTFASQRLQLEQEAATLQSQLKTLQVKKGEIENNFQQIPGLQQNYAELERQLELKSDAYNYLLTRKQELEITAAEETAPWRILNVPFLPNKPISPNIARSLLTSLVAGGFLGIATAFLLQKMDARIRQVEEVKELTRMPILGIIPKVDNPRADINVQTSRKSYSYYSSFTEGMRSLAMNLRHLIKQTGHIKTVAITSSTSAEGKTTISFNLGVVLAEFGLRVLIIDADMRKPKVHKLAQLDNEIGLSDAITSEEQPWTNFVKTSEIENLDIMTSGQTSPNPIALLNSNKMQEIIEQCQAAYDYVVIDTPPIGVIADAKSLANKVDTMLFVCGIQRVNRKSVGNALDILRSSQGDLGGVIANMVDPDFDYYAYSYYDSYYNRPTQNDNGNGDSNGERSEGGISNILQQFRRR
jgi:polysaccharide biosynthesis transport protein